MSIHTRHNGWCLACGGTGDPSIVHIDERDPTQLLLLHQRIAEAISGGFHDDALIEEHAIKATREVAFWLEAKGWPHAKLAIHLRHQIGDLVMVYAACESCGGVGSFRGHTEAGSSIRFECRACHGSGQVARYEGPSDSTGKGMGEKQDH